MLTLWGPNQQRFCDRFARRDFLKIGAFGAGLTLTDLLSARAAAGQGSSNKSAIMIFLGGGPSHLDMYDLKPNAPAEIRGEFNPIATNVPGVEISEHFPLQAAMWDKLAVLRAVVAANEHSDSEAMTGYSEAQNRIGHHPALGSVVSKLRSDARQSVPPFVSLRGSTPGSEPGFLGVAHRPFTPNGPGVQDLKMVGAVDTQRLDERKTLLAGFDTVRREIDASGTMAGLDSFAGRAFEMIASGAVRNALDLSKEPEASRARYKGVEQFLTARRLIEAGVSVVTLSIGSWDTHTDNFKTLRRQLPQVDQGIANLISDLHDRGMDQDVVTVMMGEFGRSPKIAAGAGRDHWPPVMSALIAGGGLKMGQAIGASNARGEVPQDKACTVPQILATMYRVLGIDPAMTFRNGSGRPVYLLDDRTVIRDLV